MTTSKQKKKENFHQFLDKQNKKLISLVLFIIILVIIISYIYRQKIVEIPEQQLRAIQTENLDEAYQMTSSGFQSETSFKQFKEFINKYAELNQFYQLKMTDKKLGNHLSYLGGIIESTSGSKMLIEYQLIKENNDWKIRAIKLSPLSTLTVSAIYAPYNPQIAVRDILISDTTNAKGNVIKENLTIPKSARKIFVTVKLFAPNIGEKLQVILIHEDNKPLESQIGVITQKGYIDQTFKFSTRPSWEKGNYKLIIMLPNGIKKIIPFEIK